MTIFFIGDDNSFPPVDLADENGIIAVGGDLSPGRLIEAYRNGIFPWFSEGDPIVWWSPDPRFILFPDEINISKSMKQALKRNFFNITYDNDFEKVIVNCSKPRVKQRNTWITDDMLNAYIKLHEMGFAHSVEAWHNGEIVGGLYGISFGRCFFGESMFSEVSNASKAALITLAKKLQQLNFSIIDCQVYTEHLESLGARDISRERFIRKIKKDIEYETIKGNWGEMGIFTE